jgi:hypothetical protein
VSSQAGSLNRNIPASSGPSGEGPSGLYSAQHHPEGLCPHRPEASTKTCVRVPARRETGPPVCIPRKITRRACVLTGRKPQPKHTCEFRPVGRRALRFVFRATSPGGPVSSQAGSLNRNIPASSGPSGDGPSGLYSAQHHPEGLCPHRPEASTKTCVRVPARRETGPPVCIPRNITRRAMSTRAGRCTKMTERNRSAPYALLFIGTYSDNAGPV